MKFLGAAVLLIASALVANAASLEGEITLKYDESAFSKQRFEKEFGEVVKAKTQWRVGNFFGKETLFAGAVVRNTGTTTMYFEYYVASFDQGGKLIERGCARKLSQGNGWGHIRKIRVPWERVSVRHLAYRSSERTLRPANFSS